MRLEQNWEWCQDGPGNEASVWEWGYNGSGIRLQDCEKLGGEAREWGLQEWGYTSAWGRQPVRMMLGLNLSMGRGWSTLELSSSREASEASSNGAASAKLVWNKRKHSQNERKNSQNVYFVSTGHNGMGWRLVDSVKEMVFC